MGTGIGSPSTPTAVGTLPTGTYTVVLRSASNGFVDNSGNLLDGGTNYTTTFSVTQPSLELSLPDFTRGPGQVVNVPNDTGTGIPFRLYNMSGGSVSVSSLTFMMPYNSTLLSITEAVAGSGAPGASVSVNTTSITGVAIVSFSDSTPIIVPSGQAGGATGAVNLVDLTATVPSSAPYNAVELLDLQSITLNGTNTSVGDDNAIHVSAYIGDTEGNAPTTTNAFNGTYTALEALDALNVAGALGGPFAGFPESPLVDPVVFADTESQGHISALTALDILTRAGGANVPQIPAIPNPIQVAPAGPDPALQLGSASGAAGATVLIPVNIDTAQGLDGVHLALSYDTSRLALAAVQVGSLTQGFSLTVSSNAQAGTVAVDESGSPVPGASGGSVAVLEFQIKSGAPPGPAYVDLQQSLTPQGGNEWTMLFGQDAQGQAFQFILSRAPSDAPGTPDDGIVIVLWPSP